MDPLIPITPSKTEQPQRNHGQSVMISPEESIHSSGARYAYDPTRRNFGFMSYGSQVQNSMARMGQTLPYPQLFQATPAQSGGNFTHPYGPDMGSYLAGYPGLLSLPPFLHTEMQMHGDIPSVASKQSPETISQDYYICERNGSISWTCMTPQNASFYEQGSPNVAKHSSVSHHPSLSTSPTSIQPVTPAKESLNRERKGGSQGIDLNKTPRQTQKRKKHRPKVVNEGKPRKTQQPVTPERQKRKYVRKSVSKGQSTSPSNCEKSSEQIISPGEGANPSCKRALDFDSPVSRGQGVADSAGSWVWGTDSQSYSQQVPQKRSGGTTLPSTENGLDSSLGMQDRSIHILSSDHQHAEKGLERKFSETIIAEKIQQTTTVDTNEHGHISSKKPKTIDMRKGSSPEKIRSTIASAGSNRCSSQFQFRTTETQHDPNGNICEFQLGNHYYSSNCQQKYMPPKVGQGGISSVKLLEGKPSSDEVGHLQSMLNTTKKKTRRPRKLSTDGCDQQFLTVLKEKEHHISRRYEVESETERHHLEGRSRMQDSTSHYVHSMLHTRTADAVVSVEETIEMMKCLNINGDSKPDASSQNALVVYSGNRQMVLYEGSVDPTSKKQRPRAKVDLDGETLRVWNVLMGKQGSDNTHNGNAEKEGYWREERRVFKERVDSFIARMHLVQGNRRFSRWKGSVVDSVVGVFLTQNVSDHLSSSAFMALAAKFPLDTRISGNNDMHHGQETSRSTWSKCQGSPSNQRITNEHSVRTFEVNLMEGGQIIGSDSNHPSRCLDDTLECNITATNSAVSTLDSTHSRDETISQISSEVEVEEVENVVMGPKCSDKFGGASSFIELLQMQDEESWNCYQNWRETVLCQEWYPHVFTNQKREPTVQKDVANTGDIFTGNMTGLLQSQLASIYENKNQMSQAEDITDTSQVEDVICSQNSLVSSFSYTDSCIPIGNDTGLNLELQEREKVVTGFEWCPALDGKTSYTELLHMQGSQTLQELYSINRSSVDSSSQGNEKMIHEHWRDNSLEHVKELCPFVCCGKEARQPHWQSYEMESPGVFEDDIRRCLPAHSSKTLHIEDACCTGRGHETEFPSSARIISASNSMSPISSTNNSFVQGGEHLIQTSFAAEVPRTATKLEKKRESGLDVNINIEGPLEIQESSETTFNVNIGASESRAQASTKRCEFDRQSGLINRNDEAVVTEMHSSGRSSVEAITNNTQPKIKKSKKEREKDTDWSKLRKDACMQGQEKARSCETMDSLDYEALRCTSVSEISDAIRERGMNNMLAERIKGFLDRVFHEHGKIDLEWLRDVRPDQGKDYLLSILGLGLKSVECVRLLTLHQHAFPVDTNVARIAVRLGWVPIQPLPESSQIHLLELYPMLDHVQKYLWPRLCELDQKTLYELHYQMITFGKVFCTKSRPNCNACPMKAECKHFASAFASAKLALPAPQNKSSEPASLQLTSYRQEDLPFVMPLPSPLRLDRAPESGTRPIIEEPVSPKSENLGNSQKEIEDAWWEEDPDEIPTIKLNTEQFSQSIQTYMQENNMKFEDVLMSKALVTLSAQAASIPIPKLKNISRLRTEHLVYELPDCHALLSGLDPREADDPCPYLLAIWSPGETANSVELPEIICLSQESGILCDNSTCSACNSKREANTHTVRGTLLIPCRTAMRGSFPLNGTYFQVNEVFADHDSSLEPISVPRAWIWNLPRRTVYFGTSVTSIFRGLTVESIQHCFWRGFVCVRGFDRTTRAPKPLMARLHLSASRVAKQNKQGKKASA